MDRIRRRRRVIWLAGSTALLGLGLLIGAILENLWLGLALAAIVSIVWLIAVESASAGNQGLEDPDRGVEL